MIKQFTALLWKEWREMRALFLALAIGCVVFLGGLAVWGASERHGRGDEAIIMATALFVVFAGSIIPAATFAGERRSGTLTFLVEKPISRRKVWSAKLIAGLLLWLALAVFAFVVARVLGAGLWPSAHPKPISFGRSKSMGALMWVFLTPLFSCCFFVSSGVQRSAIALLLGGVLAFVLFVAAGSLYPFSLVASSPTFATMVLLYAFFLAWLLGASWLVFSRVRDGRLVSGRQRAWALGRLLLPLPAIFLVLHIMWFLIAYSSLKPEDAKWISRIAVSPDDRNIALSINLEAYSIRHAQRCLLMDIETGSRRLLTRYNSSYLVPFTDYSTYSPDSRYMAYHYYKDWFVPKEPSMIRSIMQKLHRSVYYDELIAIFDFNTGKNQALSDPRFRRLDYLGWMNEGTMLLRGNDEQFRTFAVSTEKLQPAELPGEASTYVRVRRIAPGPLNALRGIVNAGHGPSVPGPLVLYDRNTKSWLRYPLPEDASVLDVSGDNKYVILWIREKEARTSARQAGDLIKLIDLSGDPEKVLYERKRGESLKLCGFSPDGRRICGTYGIRDDSGKRREVIWVYEVKTGLLHEITTPTDFEGGITRFSEDGLRLVWLYTVWIPRDHEKADEPRFHVLDMDTKKLTALPIPKRIHVGGWHMAHARKDDLIFAMSRGAMVFRIRYDGTGLEQIFPERRKLTVEELKDLAIY